MQKILQFFKIQFFHTFFIFKVIFSTYDAFFVKRADVVTKNFICIFARFANFIEMQKNSRFLPFGKNIKFSPNAEFFAQKKLLHFCMHLKFDQNAEVHPLNFSRFMLSKCSDGLLEDLRRNPAYPQV